MGEEELIRKIRYNSRDEKMENMDRENASMRSASMI